MAKHSKKTAAKLARRIADWEQSKGSKTELHRPGSQNRNK